MEATENIAFLVASEQRTALLRALHREGPLDKDALVDRTGAARVTVGRNLDGLVERDLVRERDAGYDLTPVGEPLVADLLSLAATVETVEHLQPFLRHVPADAFDLSLDALADAEVTVASRANPYAPVDRHAETLEGAERVRALLPAVGADPMDAMAADLAAGEASYECVVSPPVAETMTEPEFRERIEQMRAGGTMTIYQYDGTVPFYVGLVDGTVQFGVDDDDGVPRALVETDDGAAVRWAEETYEEYRDAAEPFDPDEG